MGVLAALLAAGCAQPDAPGSKTTSALPFPPLPSLESVVPMWSVRAIDAVVTHDPLAKHAKTNASYEFENKYGSALPRLRFVTAGMKVTSVTSTNGAPIEFHQDDLGPSSFGPLGPTIAPFALWNVTMPEGGAPGTRATLLVRAEGWEEILFLGGGSTGGEAPVEDANSFAQLAIVPIAEATGTPWLNVTLTRPESWTYAVDAFPTGNATKSGGLVTQAFASRTATFVIAASNSWNAIEETVSGVRVITYYHPDMLVQARSVHEVAKRALRVMSVFNGPYPYPSLTTAPAKVANDAFSAPGLTVLGLNYYRGLLPSPGVQQGRTAPWIAGSQSNEEVLVHEVTHNWWGSQVTANNSDAKLGVRDDYIVEGFTTYLAEIAYFDFVYDRADAAASVEAKWRDQQQDRAQGADAPVTAAGGDHYERAALAMRVLHAHFLYANKEDAFFQTFRDMLTTHALASGGNGVLRHEEVVRAFSQSYGEDLTPFFATWFSSRELPDVAVSAGDTTGATLENAGKVAVPVEVRFRDAGGNENLTSVWLAPGASLRVEANLTLPLVSVEADPNWRLDEASKENNDWGAAGPVALPVSLTR